MEQCTFLTSLSGSRYCEGREGEGGREEGGREGGGREGGRKREKEGGSGREGKKVLVWLAVPPSGLPTQWWPDEIHLR